ncbi:hypothetical protein ACFWZK_14925 [[Kitasatospora] papulosa]|uniref:hypothetical protein n=1 Tax=[Kitasatospora] papulosa TaxID=1464011 RepID=UPI00367A379D
MEETIRNLGDRIEEARVNGWLGEVQGRQNSLEAARNELASLDRLTRNRNRGGEKGFMVDAASWLDATELWGTAMPRTMPPVRAPLAPAPAA